MRRFIAVCFTLCLALFVCSIQACAQVEPEGQPLRVFCCTPNSDYPPFYMWPVGDEQPTGHEVDLAKAIAKQLDREVVFVGVPRDVDLRRPRVDLLVRGHADLVVSTFTITPERRKLVAFSQTYFDDGLGVLVKADSPIKSADDLQDKTIMAWQHTTAFDWVKKNCPDATVIATHEDLPEEFTLDLAGMLTADKADAYVIDRANLVALAKGNKEVRLLPDRLTTDQWGVAVRLDDGKLLAEVDSALVKLEENGELTRLRKRWLQP